MIPALFSAQKKELTTEISGSLANFQNYTPLVQVSAQSSIKEEKNILSLDVNNNFKETIKISKCGYYRLGRNQLYLCPDAPMKMNLNYKDSQEGKFEGKLSAENTYLNDTPYPSAGSYIAGGGVLLKSIPETIKKFDSIHQKRLLELNSLKISKSFYNMEKARAKADYINSLVMLKVYFPSVNNPTEAELQNFNKTYTEVVEPMIKKETKDFVNPLFLELPVYAKISPIITANNPDNPLSQKLEDWNNAVKLSFQMTKAKEKTEVKNLYDKNILSIKNPEYKSILTKLQEQLSAYGNKDLAEDFTAKDNKGKTQNLSQFKGKVIFLDFWATWCMPCLKEIPDYEALRKKYENNPNVVFLSISIDNTEAPWIKNLEKRNAEGHQWIVAREKMGKYNLESVPRTILIDKDFRIVEFRGNAPSDSQWETKINNLIQK